MIEIIPIKNNDIFEKILTKEEIKSLTINNYCYSIDINLITKILSIEDRPINNQKLFVKNILNFLTHIDANEIINNKKISIRKEIFENYFSKKHYIKYKEILSNLEIITKVPNKDGSWYKKGSYNMSYQLHNKYLNSEDLCLVIITEGRKKYDRIFDLDQRLDLDQRFLETIKNIDLNYINAIESEIHYCVSNNIPINKLKIRLNRLFALKQRRFICKGNKVDRIYHSFTNLSRISRKHFNINFNCIDIKNSQPLILTSYLKSNGFDIDDNYIKHCEEGIFYEEFYDIYKKLNNIEEIRVKVKQQIYKNIFFGFNERSLVNKRFKKLYQKTWLSLFNISKTDESLASRLQNIESELFNNLIPKKSKNYFTLFDAIYFSDTTDIPNMIKEIEEFFNKLGVKVKTEMI